MYASVSECKDCSYDITAADETYPQRRPNAKVLMLSRGRGGMGGHEWSNVRLHIGLWYQMCGCGVGY